MVPNLSIAPRHHGLRRPYTVGSVEEVEVVRPLPQAVLFCNIRFKHVGIFLLFRAKVVF